MSSHPSVGRPLRLSLGIGIVGGVALLVVAASSTRGPDLYAPYALLVGALTWALWAVRTLPRADRLVLFLIGFLLASVLLYLGIVLFLSPSALDITMIGHAWRLGFLASVGTVLGVLAAAVTGPGRRASAAD